MARQPRQLQVNLSFPWRGMNTVSPYEQIPELTSPDLQNVRAFDMTTGRKRGGQRPGLSKFNSEQASAHHIQDMIQVRTSSASGGTGALLLQNKDDTDIDIVLRSGSITSDSQGPNVELNAATSSGGFFYVALQPSSTIRDIEVTKYDTGGNEIWTTAIHVTTIYNPKATGIAVLDNIVYILVARPSTPFGLFLWRLDTDGALQDGSNSAANGAWKETGSGLTYYGYTQNRAPGSCLAAGDNRIAIVGNTLQSATQLHTAVEILRPTGTSLTTIDTGATFTESGAFRPGIIADNAGFFYHWTAENTGAGNTQKLYKITASDGSVVSGWPVSTAGALDSDLQDMSYDFVTNRLFGVGFNVTNSGKSMGVISTTDGTLTSSVDLGGLTNLTLVEHDGLGGLRALQDAAGTNLIAYDADLATPTWAAKDAGNTTHFSMTCDAGIASANEPGSAIALSVSNGTVKKFTTSGFVAPTGGGAGGALDSSSNQVFSVPFQGVAYYTDGLTYKKYTSVDDTVSTWTAATDGTLPQDADAGTRKATLIETWANRIILAGLADDRTNLFASRIGDAESWDETPATATVADPFSLANVTELGKSSDVINAVIPYNRDVLILGGDHSLRMISGNPLEGGRIDIITEITGVAYGRTWCYGPGGRVFFVGSRGGVYMLIPGAGAEPQSLTEDSIEEDVQTIEFNTSVIRLVWDDRQHGLYVFITPTDGTAGTHYFWDSRNKAWFRDVIPAAQQPYCVMVHDADDPDDRAVLIGGQAGYIRKVDYAADDDDGTAIDSYVFIPIWPVGNRNRGEMIQLTELKPIMGSNSDDVTATIHRGQTVYDALTAPAFITQTFSAGRNYNRRENCTAHAMWLKLANNTNDEGWQMENLCAIIQETSRARGRSYT